MPQGSLRTTPPNVVGCPLSILEERMNRMCLTFRLSFVLAAIFVMNAAPSLLWAQTQNASIIGVLTDQSGSVLPNVTVKVTSPAL